MRGVKYETKDHRSVNDSSIKSVVVFGFGLMGRVATHDKP